MRPTFSTLGLLAACLTGCAASDAGLATVALPIASALPARVDGFELRLDDAVLRFEAPFADPLIVEVEAGRYDRIEARGTVAGVPILLGFAADLDAQPDQVTPVDLVLDPAGRLLLVTAADLGVTISLKAIPDAPPPGTPAEYPLTFEGGSYVAVAPIGTYRIIATIDIGFGTPTEVEADTIEVVEGESPVESDLSALDDLF